MFRKIKQGFVKFPKSFWVLIAATFIDQIGGAMMFPFFSLYITDHFDVGLTQVGFVFSLFSLGSIGGNVLGGAGADKFGRKLILLVGITISGLSSLLMGYIDNFQYFYILAFIVGLVGSIGQPAQQAMVADLLPAEIQADGYGILRIAMNLTVAIGPLLGGYVLTLGKQGLLPSGIFTRNPYFILLLADAITSILTAIIIVFTIPETKPAVVENEQEESFGITLQGYLHVLTDGVFMLFLLLSALVSLVYMQMNSTLSVFLRDVHGFEGNQYGYLLSLNAFMVVFLQFPITRLVSGKSPVIMLAIGATLYAIGFGMYGFVATSTLFVVAMIIITIGEMIISPFNQTLVARLATKDKRGRYMAVSGFSWIVPSLFGVILAGFIMDNYNPSLVWQLGGLILLIAAIGYLLLKPLAASRLSDPDEIEISANEAIADETVVNI